MKLAGLTWWRNNYGSILQAYALQEVLKKCGVSYEIINQYSKKIMSVENLIEKLKNVGIKETAKKCIWRFGLKGLRLRVINMQNFINTYLNISEQVYSEDTIAEANQNYDGFICGSDQIWNPTLGSLESMYWLHFVGQGKLKIAYAPSIGSFNIKEDDVTVIRKNLENFDAISCREKSGAELINNILGLDVCQNVVDPTLLVTEELWNNICTPRIYEQKYIFVYILRGTKKQRKLIENFAKEKKLSIVTIPFLESENIELYDFKFGDIKCWDASPADFISLIKNAEYIFTDSFHCTIFSCIYHKNFWVFPKIGNDKKVAYGQLNRIKDLTEMLGINNRIINEDDLISELDRCNEINWDEVDKRIHDNRNYSLEYLKNALEK